MIDSMSDDNLSYCSALDLILLIQMPISSRLSLTHKPSRIDFEAEKVLLIRRLSFCAKIKLNVYPMFINLIKRVLLDYLCTDFETKFFC